MRIRVAAAARRDRDLEEGEGLALLGQDSEAMSSAVQRACAASSSSAGSTSLIGISPR